MILGILKRAFTFIKDEQNRNLMSWLAAAIVGVVSVVGAGYRLVAPTPDSPFEPTLEFEQIKGTLTTYEFDNSVAPTFEQDFGREVCEFTEYSPHNVSDGARCRSSHYVFIGDLSAPEKGFDVTVLNNSDHVIVVSDVSFEAKYAEQNYSACGADFVEAIPVHFDIDADHSGALGANIEVQDCNIDVLSVLDIDGFDFNEDNQSCTFTGLFDPPSRSSEDDGGWKYSRITSSEIDMYCDSADCKSTSLGSVFAYKLNDPIRFRAVLNDPIRVPGGEPFRFTVRLNSFGGFPNNLAGRFLINGSDYASNSIYIFTPDSCRRWALGQ